MVKRIIHAVKKLFGHRDAGCECCKPSCCTTKSAKKKKGKKK